MQKCPQTNTQSVWEHGVSVWEHVQKIMAGELETFRTPEWFQEHLNKILDNIHTERQVMHYALYHDCGKPYCLVTDSEGKRHFPKHEKVSKDTWLTFCDDAVVGDLIFYDMAIHRDTADKIKSYNWEKQTAFTLVIVSLAELHSNAKMFGGIESISFKSKYKKWQKRAKMLYKLHGGQI